MTKHFNRELETIQTRLLKLFAVVEQMIHDATRALCHREVERAEQILVRDKTVNTEEVLIEEECLKTLALHQPVAGDLRQIATILKINSDLERIADLACNIGERAIGLHEYPYFPIPDRLSEMATDSTEMVRNALNAFVSQDLDLAKQVIFNDQWVDELNRKVISEIKSVLSSDATQLEPALHCFSASRHLERIADHAENIAEDVIYMISGDIIRHKHGNFTINVD
ncbi:MAG TPA: phosphate signaling complex protein PhoU [Pirellulaceae bacterium]|nr:phosphate signaling complex protein PhoU [Pirellulaceae bacterium]HMO92029.1 phosphate signaling complex protein PhoU [Pirellulaceae bacterium]HMP68828.1 phosphate signaling complex protein PhoU [Pirellulaceae bacterium]